MLMRAGFARDEQIRLLEREDTFADLAYAPWPDMERTMREEGMPIYGLESRRPLGQFDLVGFSLGYELAYTNMLNMIDMAGSPLRTKDRGEGDPIYLAGGSCALNPTVVGPFLDLVLLGDGPLRILGGILNDLSSKMVKSYGYHSSYYLPGYEAEDEQFLEEEEDPKALPAASAGAAD